MRKYEVYEVGFLGRSLLMNSIQDDWGIDDVVISEIKSGSYKEAEALKWWLAMLATARPGAICVDAGSYTGLYSLFAARERSDVRAVAVEASSVTFGRLLQNVLVNNFDILINPNHVALSDTGGVAKLAHGYGVLAMASGESLAPTYQVDHVEMVPATTMDALLLQLPEAAVGAIGSKSSNILPITSICAMKMDVEGVEFQALQGAQEILKRYQPPLVVEILSDESWEQCSSLLFTLGYEQVAKCDGLNYVFCGPKQKDELLSAFAHINRGGPAVFSAVPFQPRKS